MSFLRIFTTLLMCLIISACTPKTPTLAPKVYIVPTNAPTWTPKPTTTKTIRTPIPPPTQRATITPMPTSTAIKPIKGPSGGGGGSSASNPSNSSPSVDCNSSDMVYAKRIHKINMDYLKETYNIWVPYYQHLLDEAVRNRDALGASDAKHDLDNFMSKYNADVDAENKEYKSHVPKACR